MIIETLKVKSGDTESGFIIINKSDFNAAEHEVFDDAAKVGDSRIPVKQLAAHLETLTDIDAVKALASADDRSSAAPLYEARLKSLTDPK